MFSVVVRKEGGHVVRENREDVGHRGGHHRLVVCCVVPRGLVEIKDAFARRYYNYLCSVGWRLELEWCERKILLSDWWLKLKGWERDSL